MLIRPRRRTGALFGAAMVLLALGGAGLLAWQVAREPPSFASFTAGAVAVTLLLLAALFGYWTYGCWSLCYHLDRNRLALRWAGNQQVIPLAEVGALVPGLDAPEPVGLGGLGWPGCHIGRGRVPGFEPGGRVLFFSTHQRRSDLLYVVTPFQTYGISVPDAPAFAQELKLRLRLGPTERLEQRARRWLLWDLPAWHDPLVVGMLALGLLVNVALFAYQSLLMPGLPELLPLHYTPLGAADRIGFREELFLLPATGLAALGMNAAVGIGLHRWERFIAYLAQAGALALQGVLWGATLKLLG